MGDARLFIWFFLSGGCMAAVTSEVDSNEKSTIIRIEDPPVAKYLFGDVRIMPWIWLVLRLYLGYEWLMAGWGKLQSPVWTGDKAGVAIAGFVKGALAKTAGDHPDVSGWYASFLQNVVLPNATTWSYLVTFGEILVGLGLILGIFTGIAAFFGAFMNYNYLLAGTVSTNPAMLFIGLLLILAWKIAGWVGLDRWVLFALGTPWSAGRVFKK
jgi:thiosulfate dehydrogenase (quinone) large subunit